MPPPPSPAGSARPRRAATALQVPRLLPAPRGEPGRGLQGRGRGDSTLSARDPRGDPRHYLHPATPPLPDSACTHGGTRCALPLEGLSARTPSAAACDLGCVSSGCAPLGSWRQKSLCFLEVGVGQPWKPRSSGRRGTVAATSPPGVLLAGGQVETLAALTPPLSLSLSLSHQSQPLHLYHGESPLLPPHKA